MAKDTKPTSLLWWAYQAGFGDCFLLTFHYSVQRPAYPDRFRQHRHAEERRRGDDDAGPDIELQCGGVYRRGRDPSA